MCASANPPNIAYANPPMKIPLPAAALRGRAEGAARVGADATRLPVGQSVTGYRSIVRVRRRSSLLWYMRNLASTIRWLCNVQVRHICILQDERHFVRTKPCAKQARAHCVQELQDYQAALKTDRAMPSVLPT
jgi:hypothetical protein